MLEAIMPTCHSLRDPISENDMVQHTRDWLMQAGAGAFSGPRGRPAATGGHLFGKYALVERIGRGGMGDVWKARDTQLQRWVAIKILHGNGLEDGQEADRFCVEAQAAARLHHPNIVALYEAGELDGGHYLAMELVEGNNLARLLSELSLPPAGASETHVVPGVINRQSRERQATLVRLVISLARAVHYAHEEGVIHRDIKPGNILIGKDGSPHLTDFGIAKLMDQPAAITVVGEYLGTPCYTSPEQTAGSQEVGPGTDIYSLGAILYELLTGQPPFRGANQLETLDQVVRLSPVSPRLRNPRVDQDLAIICLKCLEKKPSRRYATALALAEDLERWLRHETICARRAGAGERLTRWVWSHPMPALLVACLMVCLFSSVLAQREISSQREQNRVMREFLEEVLVGEGLGRVSASLGAWTY